MKHDIGRPRRRALAAAILAVGTISAAAAAMVTTATTAVAQATGPVREISVVSGEAAPAAGKARKKRKIGTRYVFSGGVLIGELLTTVHCSNTGDRKARVRVVVRGEELIVSITGNVSKLPREFAAATTLKPHRSKIFATTKQASGFHHAGVNLGIPRNMTMVPISGEIVSPDKGIVCAVQNMDQEEVVPEWVYTVALEKIDG